MRRVTTFFAVCMFLVTAAFAGTVVYDNGGPNQQSGNEMTNWIQAEDFTFSVNTLITDVHFWTIEQQGGYAGSIYYGIYTNNGGTPNLNAPGVEGFAAGANLTRTATGNTPLGMTEYYYSFDITSFTAQAGVTYWLGLHNGPLTTVTRAEVYWETTNTNATLTGQEDILPPAGDAWSGNGQEHAFQLTGTGTPEPASMALFGAGLAALALLRRRRA